MSCHYIALVGHDARWCGQDGIDAEAALLKLGMHHCLTSGPICLFASEGTPMLPVPGGGMVIGHVFARDGAVCPAIPANADIRGYLLEKCWGEYLLFRPAAKGKGGFTVMRDPSSTGGLACVYSLQGGSGFITSDISLATSLGLYRKQIDWNAVSRFLMHPHKMARHTALTGIRELLPGCALHLRGEKVVETLEWSPWKFAAADVRHINPDEAAADLRTAVEASVRTFADRHDSILMELSGGLDSSIVAACLQGTRARVVCCTLETPVPGANERQYAQLVADRLGVELATAPLDFGNARFDFALPKNSVSPRIGPLQYAINEVMQAAAEHHGASACFSGGGGDSVFGYIRTAAPAADAFKARGVAAGLTSVQNLSELHQCTLWKAGRLTLKKLLSAPKPPAPADMSFLRAPAPFDASKDHPWYDAPPHNLPGDRERVFDLAGNQAFRDSLDRGLNRAVYMPLLAQPVVEACLKVPSWMWIAQGHNRAIARAAFANELPADVLNRRSKGTLMSYLGAIYQQQKVEIRDYLAQGKLEAHGLLDADALHRFVASQLPPRDHSFTRLFELCRIENWVRHQT